MRQVGALSESLEDYLETIYNLQVENGAAKVSDIADARGVSMASVCQALKRLDREGLVDYSARESLELTPEGRRLAQKISSRHRFVFRFLSHILGVDKDVAEKDACSLEHHLSKETLSHLVAFTQFAESGFCGEEKIMDSYRRSERTGQVRGPRRRPRRRQGRPRHREGPFLSELKPGRRARIMHLHASCAIRQRLVDMGLLPGVEVEMIRVAPLGDPVEVKIRDLSLSLRKSEAAAIEVEPLP
ncbi:hypothetical protein GF402_00695 [Candidatus Fermentibacteria bacterium]|nr:hypothetical protein [Candidatus Fermentibacteria bacterium]